MVGKGRLGEVGNRGDFDMEERAVKGFGLCQIENCLSTRAVRHTAALDHLLDDFKHAS